MGRIGKSAAYRTAKGAIIASLTETYTMWTAYGKTYFFEKGRLQGIATIPLLTELYE